MCTYDGCPPINVKIESTTNCSNCNVLVHLPCIGISAKLAQIQSPNMKIFCNKCVNEQAPLVDLTDVKNTPRSKVTIAEIMKEVKSLRQCIESQSQDMREIKAELAKKAADKPFEPEVELLSFVTPKTKKKSTVAKTPLISYAGVARNGPQPSAKRMRTEKTSEIAKFNAPKPKTGTKTEFTGLSVVGKPKRIEKPKFTKALWVSRIGPETTEGELADWISKNTTVTDCSKFKAHKLVKKDCDLKSLKFVSFKIEMNDEEYNILCDPNIWPEEVMVREFLQGNTLGDHIFPALHAKNPMKNVEFMDTTDSSNQKQPEIQMPSATSTQVQPSNDQS